MSKLDYEIITIKTKDGEEFLRKKARKVDIRDPKLRSHVDTLRKACMDLSNSFALAAPQIGYDERLVYVKTTDFDAVMNAKTVEDLEKIYEKSRVFINPEIVSKEGLTTSWEYCFSCDPMVGKVKRPYKIKVRYQDLEGAEHEEELTSFAATVLCHEIDHLDGILHIDIADEVKEAATLEKRKELRAKDGYKVIAKDGDYEKLKLVKKDKNNKFEKDEMER